MFNNMASVTVNIKSVSGPDCTIENVPLSASLAQLRELIQSKHPSHPAPADQTLICGGKVLKDPNVTVQDFAKIEPGSQGPVNLHLVIRHHAGPSSTTAAASAPAPSTPPAPPTTAATASTPSAQPQAAPTANATAEQTSIPSVSSTWQSLLPTYAYLNPVVATAYQAAYTAALAAGMSVQAQHTSESQPAQTSSPPEASAGTSDACGSSTIAPPETPAPALQGAAPAVAGAAAAMSALRPMTNWPLQSLAFTQAYLASVNAMTTVQTQESLPASTPEQQQYQQIVQLLMGAQGVNQYPNQLLFSVPQPAQQQVTTQQLLNLLLQQPGVPSAIAVSANGDVANILLGQAAAAANNTGLRNRRNAAAAAMAQAAAQQRPQRVRRQRVFTLRINMRTLLQLLVFGMVLYQHFTWKRFFILLFIATALWITSLAPLRRFVASLQAPPPAPVRPAAAQPAANAAEAPQPAAAEAAGGAGQGDAGAGANAQPAAAPAAAPAPAPAPQPANRGILKEIAVVLVGFVTSLLPAWNYNPEDAAIFAAAQEGMAAAAQQQQGQPAAPAAVAQRQAAEEDEAAAVGQDQEGAVAAGQDGHEHQD